MASCAHYEQMLEKCGREKSGLALQLEDSRSQLLQAEKDLAKMQSEVKGEIKSALKGMQLTARPLNVRVLVVAGRIKQAIRLFYRRK